MKIFVSTYPFGRLDPQPIRLLQESGHSITINPLDRKLKGPDLVELALDYDGLIAGTEDLLPLINRSKQLKYIARVGIGLDSVPLALCRHKRIEVSYTPDAVTPAVAEFSIGLFIDGLRYIKNADKALRRGEWTRPVGRRIAQSTIGLIGFGRVGQSVSRLLASFSPPAVLVNDIRDISVDVKKLVIETGLNIQFASKEDIFRQADIVSVHVPLTKLTRGLVAQGQMALMKSDSLLVNVSRGGIINEEALARCLQNANSGPGYAALDVFENEPYSGPLVNLDNVTLTQHMASCSIDCRVAMEAGAAEDMIRMCNGKPPQQPVPDSEVSAQDE